MQGSWGQDAGQHRQEDGGGSIAGPHRVHTGGRAMLDSKVSKGTTRKGQGWAGLCKRGALLHRPC